MALAAMRRGYLPIFFMLTFVILTALEAAIRSLDIAEQASAQKAVLSNGSIRPLGAGAQTMINRIVLVNVIHGPKLRFAKDPSPFASSQRGQIVFSGSFDPHCAACTWQRRLIVNEIFQQFIPPPKPEVTLGLTAVA